MPDCDPRTRTKAPRHYRPEDTRGRTPAAKVRARDNRTSPRVVTEEQPDGTRTEYFEVEPRQEVLLAILRDLFEEHWDQVVFGPCIPGAVFEGRFGQRPSVTLRDGYVTVQVEGAESWHFHLCIGSSRGTRSRPTSPALAAWRRCGRAAFFRDSDAGGRHGSWGFRMWNGRGEQMITIFFPNPWLSPDRARFVRTPDWSRLGLWMQMRERYAGLPAEPPPTVVDPPRTH